MPVSRLRTAGSGVRALPPVLPRPFPIIRPVRLARPA